MIEFAFKPDSISVLRPNAVAAVLAALSLWVFLPTGHATAQPVAPSDGMAGASFCNYSGDDMFVAVVAIQSLGGPWMKRGWATIADKQCSSVGRYVQANFYYYVRLKNQSVLGGDDKGINVCIQNGAFSGNYYTNETCNQNEQAVRFVTSNLHPNWSMAIFNLGSNTSLPSASAALSESQSLYDACEAMWNSANWVAKTTPKAMAAAIKHNPNGTYVTQCFAVADQPDELTAINSAQSACLKDGWTCYDFSRGNSLVPWSIAEMNAITLGQRK